MSAAFLVAFLISAPYQISHGKDPGAQRPARFFKEAKQRLKLLSEGVADACDGGGPNDRSERVEFQESQPLHAQYSRERSRDRAQAEDETRKKHGLITVVLDQVLGGLDVLIVEVATFLDPAKKGFPEYPAQQKSEVVADGGGDRRYQDDPKDVQLRGLVREETGEHQGRLAGHRDSGVFRPHADRHGPVTPNFEEMLDCVVEPVHRMRSLL
ncbi:MAG TPA: hypothetical protein VF283_10930 [Bryobacteraceae bacterium]